MSASRHNASPESPAVIRLSGVSVCYRLPKEKITSFKEYAIRSAQRRIAYENFWALRDVTLEVFPGEVVGVIGQNGAGKSTLLKTVARVLRPTEGRVIVRGRVAPLLELGAGFDYELTGRENIFLNGALLGLSRAEMQRRFAGIVEFAELEEFIDAPLRTYSTGMVARLGFSIATDVNPEVLIIDEVLAVGDERFQNKCQDRIRRFRESGTTILLVSHSAHTIRTQCDRAIWLEHGRVMTAGTPANILRQYKELRDGEPSSAPGADQATLEPDMGTIEDVTRYSPQAPTADDDSTTQDPVSAAEVIGEPPPAGIAEPRPSSPEHPDPAAPSFESETASSEPVQTLVPHSVTRADAFFGLWLSRFLSLHSSLRVPLLVDPREPFPPRPDSLLTFRHAAAFFCSVNGWLHSRRRAAEDEPADADTFLAELERRGFRQESAQGTRSSPDAPLTRGELATLLCQAREWTALVPSGRFLDVPVSLPWAGFIERLAEERVTVGTGGGKFSPEAHIPWRHACVWLERTFGAEDSP